METVHRNRRFLPPVGSGGPQAFASAEEKGIAGCVAVRGNLDRMASAPYIYNGPGYSPQREKSRFVLPSGFRSTLKESSGGLIVCLGRDAKRNCLLGFGISRKIEMQQQYLREMQHATDNGLDFDAVERGTALFNFSEVSFDENGRFTLPKEVAKSANIQDEIFFMGGGLFFTAWNPDELDKSPGLETLKAICSSIREGERAKVKGK
jgi:MraZ protein